MSRNLVEVDLPITNGYPYAAPIMKCWLELFHAYMQQRHGWQPTINKLAEKPRKDGRKSISGTTHLDGHAVDWRTWNLTRAQRELLIREASRFGLQGHYRTVAQDFQPHIHGMLDVGHWTQCKYQLDATKRGRSGLGAGGLKGPDAEAHLRTKPWVTAQYGITQLKKSLDTRTDLERLLDTMDTSELRKIIREEIDKAIDSKIGRVPHVDPMTGEVDSSKPDHAVNTALRILEQQAARAKVTGYAVRPTVDRIEDAVKDDKPAAAKLEAGR